MAKIVIIGAGAMGSAFALPCLDNNHDINIIGTHLENDFIERLKSDNNLHPGLNTQIPQEIKIFKFEKFEELLKSNVDLIVLGISSKGIEWVSDQLSKLYKDTAIPKLLMLTKGLSIYNNQYELLVDKLERLLAERGIKKVDISAVGGPCLAAGLAYYIAIKKAPDRIQLLKAAYEEEFERAKNQRRGWGYNAPNPPKVSSLLNFCLLKLPSISSYFSFSPTP